MTSADRIREYDPRQRFRLYRTTPDGDLEHVMAAGADSPAGLGVMLVQFHEEGEIDPADEIGIMDTDAWQVGEPGTWILNPFASVWHSETEARR